METVTLTAPEMYGNLVKFDRMTRDVVGRDTAQAFVEEMLRSNYSPTVYARGRANLNDVWDWCNAIDHAMAMEGSDLRVHRREWPKTWKKAMVMELAHGERYVVALNWLMHGAVQQLNLKLDLGTVIREILRKDLNVELPMAHCSRVPAKHFGYTASITYGDDTVSCHVF